MSLLSSRPARVPGPLGYLCALLALLLLLTPPGPLSPAGPVAAAMRELRCSCLQTTQGVQPQMISNLQVFAIGPQCSEVEVVASLKNGTEVCLDPQAPFLKKVIQKILDGSSPTRGLASQSIIPPLTFTRDPYDLEITKMRNSQSKLRFSAANILSFSTEQRFSVLYTQFIIICTVFLSVEMEGNDANDSNSS
uniref:C-X-C motif chemokine 5 n=1 Tax=Macaca mulatta TaxID=9544 RepID=UPI0010A203A3|nr:C-X-C motif chemokine 5 [Macaca mulatta]